MTTLTFVGYIGERVLTVESAANLSGVTCVAVFGWNDNNLTWTALIINIPMAVFNVLGMMTSYQIESTERKNWAVGWVLQSTDTITSDTDTDTHGRRQGGSCASVR